MIQYLQISYCSTPHLFQEWQSSHKELIHCYRTTLYTVPELCVKKLPAGRERPWRVGGGGRGIVKLFLNPELGREREGFRVNAEDEGVTL